MADVGKVDPSKQGPSPIGPKKKKGLSEDQFRELMKSGKVRETDPEEQRKRKSKSEKEEEEAAEMTTAQPSAPDQLVPRVAPFELNIKESAGVEGVAESAAAAPEEAPPPLPPTPPYFPPPPEEGETLDVTTPQQPQAERRREPQQQKQVQRTPETAKKEAKVEKKQPAKAAAPAKHPPADKAKPKAKETEKEQEGEEQAVPYAPPHPLAHALPTEEKKMEEPPPLAKGAWEATEDLERGEDKLVKKVAPVKKEGPTIPTTFQQAPPPAAPVLLPGEPLPPITAPFAHLPAPVAALFERMVGVMTVMNTTGVTQTTINLDNPRFEGSAFYGAQIIISEFSTAPKAYNIQLLGNQRAVDLFTANAQELVAAFQAGNYTFKVNRIDTGYITGTPEVRRRETRRVKRKRGAEE